MYRIEATDLTRLKKYLHHAGLTQEGDWLWQQIDGPAVAARCGDRIVGAARVYKTWLHPRRWRLAIHVAPDWRRQGIGTDLLNEIFDRLLEKDRSLQASVFANNTAGMAFLEGTGFGPLMTTRLRSLDVPMIPITWRERCSRTELMLERHSIHIESLASRPDLYADTALLHERIYREQHTWNPPRPLTPEECAELFMDEAELDPAM